jgi:hypothetical protein
MEQPILESKPGTWTALAQANERSDVHFLLWRNVVDVFREMSEGNSFGFCRNGLALENGQVEVLIEMHRCEQNANHARVDGKELGTDLAVSLWETETRTIARMPMLRRTVDSPRVSCGC